MSGSCPWLCFFSPSHGRLAAIADRAGGPDELRCQAAKRVAVLKLGVPFWAPVVGNYHLGFLIIVPLQAKLSWQDTVVALKP